MKNTGHDKELARRTAKSLTSRVIRALQRLTDCKLSGDDSELKNIWDEICVQVQFEAFSSWDAYEETERAIIIGEIEGLPAHEREALWLQTDQGCDWWCQDEDNRKNFRVCNDDIVEYLLKDHVLREAGCWSNERIRSYLERSTRTD